MAKKDVVTGMTPKLTIQPENKKETASNRNNGRRTGIGRMTFISTMIPGRYGSSNITKRII